MLMYAPSDDLTLMAMITYIQLEMDHITRTGVRFTTRSEGFGDLNLGARYTVFRHNFDEHRVILSGAVSFPTGSIEEKDFKACSKCKGDMYFERDAYGAYRKCLQCGKIQDLEPSMTVVANAKPTKLAA